MYFLWEKWIRLMVYFIKFIAEIISVVPLREYLIFLSGY